VWISRRYLPLLECVLNIVSPASGIGSKAIAQLVTKKPAFSIGLKNWLVLAVIMSLAACSMGPLVKQEGTKGKTVCDSYIILHMCVQDYVGDGIVDLIYFSDTNEIFMYREGMKDIVAPAMPFHQCVVPLGEQMQEISNRILFREDLSFGEELAIKKDLLFAYLDAKPGIDACNRSFADEDISDDHPADVFFIEESEWEDQGEK